LWCVFLKEEENMKNDNGKEKITALVFPSLWTIAFILLFSSMALGQNNSIVLPKGTTVQKLSAGHFKFTLPNRQIVDVSNFNLKLKTTGSISIIDPSPPDKPVVNGTRGSLVLSGILTKEAALKLQPTEYIAIDDEVTWLPITITYIGPKMNINRDLNKLNPQPEPPIYTK
jgi:hypothetical protein